MPVDIWNDIGFMRWPLAFSVLMVAALTLYSARSLWGPRAASDLKAKAWIDAILFWGGFALISGVLGTLLGIVLAAQSIEAAGNVSTTLVWGGVKIALLTSVIGTLTLAVSSLLWFVLQMRWRLLEAELRQAT